MSKMEEILSVEKEEALRKPINDYVGGIQKKIDELRKDGTDRVQYLKNHIQIIKENRTLSQDEKQKMIADDQAALSKAQAVEEKNKAEVASLVEKAETYLRDHYSKEVYQPVSDACAKAKQDEDAAYQSRLQELLNEHNANVAKLQKEGGADLSQEIKDENYVYKNKVFDAKMVHEQVLQQIRDRKHEAFSHQYHLIDLLRMSKFTFGQSMAQKAENRKYTFNRKEFLLNNGLYIVILLIFIGLCIATPILKNTQLLTLTNILNILQQASPRMFLALGVAGLILLTGTDLSIGRMVGMGMVTSTIIMHQGINTGGVFGHIFDFTGVPQGARIILALCMNIILCMFFTSIAGFFTARFKIHPFVATMSNMLIIFGLVTYATKGVSFGAIEPAIQKMIMPRIGKFPTIILWAVAAIFIVWFIWNKTTLGKNMYAVGGNPEAAAASGISVFKVTIITFAIAGILYGFGGWLECIRMVGSGSSSYGQGWETDAIAACVVGGISFKGGIGKIQGIVVGVLIFTALTYSLTILGVDTNLQFVFSGIIILTAVTIDCLKYVQKK